MTIEMQALIEKEIADAEAAHDGERMQRAIARATLAMIDCQRKTAERVKELLAANEARKNTQRGVKLAWDVLKLLASAGGGAVILKVVGAA